MCETKREWEKRERKRDYSSTDSNCSSGSSFWPEPSSRRGEGENMKVEIDLTLPAPAENESFFIIANLALRRPYAP